jgi:hypothetical protein
VKYTAVHRAFMVTGLAVEAPCAALGAWLRLQSFCSSDGVEKPTIERCAEWTDRQWLLRTQLTSAEVATAVEAGLARWDGDALEVAGFDADGLRAIEAKRNAGVYGRLGGPKRKPSGSPTGNPMGNPEGLKSGTHSETPSPSFPSFPSSPTQPAAVEPATVSGLALVGKTTKRQKKSETPFSQSFEAFWQEWPVKIGKAAAFEAWRGNGCEESDKAATVTVAAKAQRPYFETRPRDKVPHASTWLNGARWTDEVISPEAALSGRASPDGAAYQPLIARKATP